MISNKVAALGKLMSWTNRKSLLNGLKVNRLVGCYSTDTETPKAEPPVNTSETKTSFSKAFDKYTGHENFAKLIRNSPFVRLGEPRGKLVEGIIHHIIEDDLYIDFGGKFDCVCLRPQKNGSAYRLGTKVRIVLHDPELSSRFLGAVTDLTILEADGTLVGLIADSKNEEEEIASLEPPGQSITQQLLTPATQF